MSRRARLALLAAPLAFLLLFFVFPLVSIVGHAVDGSGFARVLGEARVRQVIWFTVWQAAASTALTLLVGLPIAYVVSRFAFRGRGTLEALVLVPFVLPTVVVGMAFTDLPGAVVGILAAHLFFNLAVVVRVVGTAWGTMDPALEDAADELGARGWRRVTAVLLPLARPSIVGAATLVFLFTFTSFGVVLLLGGAGRTTIEVEIFRRTSQFLDLSAAAVLALVQIVFVSALLVADAALAARTAAFTPTTGGRRRPRTQAELAALWLIVIGTVAIVVVPLLRLLRRSLTGPSGLTLDNYLHLGAARRGGVFEIDAGGAIWTSVKAAALAAALALALGGLVAVAIGLGSRGRGTAALVAMPLGVSAVALGFGYVVAFDRDPIDLRGSPWLVPLAQALVAMPFVVRVLAPALSAANRSFGESAASLGASPWRAFRDATLPASATAVRTSAIFAFVVAFGEFGATSFLARADRPTVPVAIARLLGQPGSASIGQASALAVLLMAVTVVAAIGLARLPARLPRIAVR